MSEMCGCPGIVGLHERDEWCPREFPLGGFCRCGQPYGSLHSCPDRATSPDRAAAETLALIEQHRLTVRPAMSGQGWAAAPRPEDGLVRAIQCVGEGPTIGDAVRACVARLTK